MNTTGTLTTKDIPPGPYGYPLVGVLPQMRRNMLQFLTESVQQYGDVVLLRMGSKRVTLLCHPEHISHVLQENHSNYRKSEFIKKIKPFLGQGLATSEGEVWRRQRRLAQPAFHRQRIAGLAKVVTGATEDMLASWGDYANSRKTIDVLNEMMQLTGQIIVRALFGTEISHSERVLTEEFSIVTQYSLKRILSVIDWGEFLPTPSRRQFDRAMDHLNEVVWGIIRARRKSNEGREDLLSMLLNAQDSETNERMNDEQLRDEVMTMFFAGHETTGLALTWTWYLLAQHSEIEKRLREEVEGVLQDRVSTIDDLSSLIYTKMVIQEAMRLYPPAWVISRAAIRDDEIGGYRIPANSALLLSPYLTHRHPKFWNDPEQFDPERFSPNKDDERPRYAYYPFSGGPRHCIGEQFALMEAQLIVATVVRRFHLDGIPGQKVEPQPLLTLRPQHGLPMRVQQV